LLAINFSAKVSLGLGDFDHDMLHFSLRFSALILAESRQIDSFWGLIFHPSINRNIGLLTETRPQPRRRLAKIAPGTSFPEINHSKDLLVKTNPSYANSLAQHSGKNQIFFRVPTYHCLSKPALH